ncbi:hypothetical protein [Nostoc linckia]|uniref:hypothetical protein n=1 Tax=Nostoc linckia TaxID=92942 RepID=UPI00118089C5|nr:hypothetical protein [Nostoc linckia]
MFVSPSLAANPDFADNQPLHQNYPAMAVAMRSTLNIQKRELLLLNRCQRSLQIEPRMSSWSGR